jgi:voltage-gated potassium channel
MWQQDDSGRVTHRFEGVVLAATLALIPVLIVESEKSSGGWHSAAIVANWVIWAIFLVELAFVLVVAPRKAAALRAHWLDVAIVVLTVPALGSFLSSLRVLRLTRLLRLLRFGVLLGRMLKSERGLSSAATFRVVGAITVLLVVVAGAAESTVDEKDFPTLWDGVWWAIVTVTTVGYGDYVPHSVAGRITAIVVMLAGIGFIGVFTASVASRFVQTDQSEQDEPVLASLARIEAELAELRRELAGSGPRA